MTSDNVAGSPSFCSVITEQTVGATVKDVIIISADSLWLHRIPHKEGFSREKLKPSYFIALAAKPEF